MSVERYSMICNVASALSQQAAQQPDTPAIHYPTGLKGGKVQYQHCDYRTLDQLSDCYARGLLEYGIERNTRTALMVTPGLEFFALFFALFKMGAVPVLIDPGIGMKPLKTCLQEAQPEAFIGISKAHVARVILGWARSSLQKWVTVGPKLGWSGLKLDQIEQLGARSSDSVLAATRADDMAAILFTSGSTGIPKGVVYRHRHFVSQVEMLKRAFDIRPGEVDLPTFPPFALFDPALGMSTVVPWMDPTRPAKADPAKLVAAIDEYQVSNVFGSPALLRNLGYYTEQNNIQLSSVKRIISAGAAVPTEVIRRLQPALTDGAAIHTPYGATECLPVASISSHELTEEITDFTASGEGICVGHPMPENQVVIINTSDEVIDEFKDATIMPSGMPGEIVVHGPTTSDHYWQRDQATAASKIHDDQGRIWHRMGDIGWLDSQQRLWYCGRKSQRVETQAGTLFADQIEAIFNIHPDVARTALVGIGGQGQQQPVLCVELSNKQADKQSVKADLLQMAQINSRTHDIHQVFFHPAFPVDIRHNAKIGREKLALWAAKQS